MAGASGKGLVGEQAAAQPLDGPFVAGVLATAAEHGIHTSIAVDTLAGILGFFEAMCREPDPPGLPTLRAFQRFQADALRGWLRASPLAAHLQVVGPDDPAR